VSVWPRGSNSSLWTKNLSRSLQKLLNKNFKFSWVIVQNSCSLTLLVGSNSMKYPSVRWC
jgi:hypothetical protein